MKKALQGRFSVPDSDSLQSDLISVGYKYDSAAVEQQRIREEEEAENELEQGTTVH